MLETAVRRRVRALPKIALLSEHDVEAPVYDAGASRVTGVVVKNRGTGESTTLEADLVVDALGRGSSSPQWLASWGFGEVTVELVKVDVGYASARFERRFGDVFGSNGAVITGTAPRETRHGFIIGAGRLAGRGGGAVRSGPEHAARCSPARIQARPASRVAIMYVPRIFRSAVVLIAVRHRPGPELAARVLSAPGAWTSPRSCRSSGWSRWALRASRSAPVRVHAGLRWGLDADSVKYTLGHESAAPAPTVIACWITKAPCGGSVPKRR